jgi:hypothetical protein
MYFMGEGRFGRWRQAWRSAPLLEKAIVVLVGEETARLLFDVLGPLLGVVRAAIGLVW